MGSRYAPRFGVSLGLGILRESWNALTQSNMEFPEVFEDYEKYHSAVNTGNLSRARLVEEWIEPGATILDVGVGDGTVSDYLIKNKKVKVTGLDISATACEKARRLGIQTEIRDITGGLGLSDDTFYDYILLLEVIEHTAYPQKILNDAINHAKKGIIVTIPNSGYIKWRIQMLRGYVPRQSFTHLHFWSVKDFEIFCQLANIKIIEFKTFSARSSNEIQKPTGMATMLVIITKSSRYQIVSLHYTIILLYNTVGQMEFSSIEIGNYVVYLYPILKN